MVCDNIQETLDSLFIDLQHFPYTCIMSEITSACRFSGRAFPGPVCGFLVFWFHITTEPFALVHHSVCGYMCFTMLFH